METIQNIIIDNTLKRIGETQFADYRAMPIAMTGIARLSATDNRSVSRLATA